MEEKRWEKGAVRRSGRRLREQRGLGYLGGRPLPQSLLSLPSPQFQPRLLPPCYNLKHGPSLVVARSPPAGAWRLAQLYPTPISWLEWRSVHASLLHVFCVFDRRPLTLNLILQAEYVESLITLDTFAASHQIDRRR